jgi:hypothetical protein
MRRAASRRSIRRRRIRHPGLVADHYESARLGVRRRPLAACRRSVPVSGRPAGQKLEIWATFWPRDATEGLWAVRLRSENELKR